MANFWEADELVDEPWNADAEVATRTRRPVTIDAKYPEPSYMEAFGERALEMGRDVLETRSALSETIPAAAKNMAAGAGRWMADRSSVMQGAAAESYARHQTDDPQVQAQQQRAVQGFEDIAFQSDLRSGELGRTARRAAIEGEEAIPADAGPIQRGTIQGLTSASLALPATLLAGPEAGAAVLGIGAAGSRYTDLIDKGVPRDVATKSAMMMGSLEGLTEFLPGKALVKNVPGFWQRLAEFMVAELPGENINSVAQIIDDYRLQLRDDVTKDDILQAIQDTSIATMIGGGAQAGAAQLLQNAIERANAKQPMNFQMQMPEPILPALPDLTQPFVPPESDFIVDDAGNVYRPGENDIEVQEAEQTELTGQEPVLDPAEGVPPLQVDEGPVEEVTMEGDGQMLPGEIRVEQTPTEDIVLESEPEPTQPEPAGTMAERRERMLAKRDRMREAITPDTNPLDVTYVAGEHGSHGVAVGGRVLAWFQNEETARNEVRNVRRDIKSGRIDLQQKAAGEALEYPTVRAQRAPEYPTAPKDEWYGNADYENTGGRIVEMSPDEFLGKVRPLDIDESSRDNIDSLKEHIESGRTLDPLTLYASGKEDGRHRAVAAKELGIKKVPVLVFGGNVGNTYGTKAERIAQPQGQRRAATQEAIRSYRERYGAQSPAYTKRSGGDGGSLRVLGVPAVAELKPSENFKGTLDTIGAASPSFYEINSPDARTFRDSIAGSKTDNKFSAAVYVYSEDEYKGMRMFVADDGRAGFALKGDDIVSVFGRSPHKGVTPGALELAVQEGGRRLDAFDTVLPDLYAANGFRTVARMKWNEEYKPEGWDKATFAKFNNGEPDVVFMVYDPSYQGSPSNSDGVLVDNYDAGVEEQKKALGEKPRAQRNETKTQKVMPQEREVRAEINRLLKGYQVRPPLTVVQSHDQLPVRVQKLVPDENIRAFMLDGKMYVIADRVPSIKSLADTVQHEITVHYGLRAMLPTEEMNVILDGVARDNPMELRRRGRQEYGNDFDPNNIEHRRHAAEEVLAYYGGPYLAGESVPDRIKRWLDRLIAALREYIHTIRGKEQKFDERWMKRFVQDLQTYVKSGPTETTQPAAEPVAQRGPPTFFSALTRAAETAKRNVGTANEWLGTLRNMQGVKPEEIEWSGLEEWINSLDHRPTKEEVVEFLRANQIEVQDALKGGTGSSISRSNRLTGEITALGYTPRTNIQQEAGIELIRNNDGRVFSLDDEDMPLQVRELADELADVLADEHLDIDMPTEVASKYSKYTMPGGENYRELLLTLPQKESAAFQRLKREKEEALAAEQRATASGIDVTRHGEITDRTDRATRLVDEARAREAQPFMSSHWQEKNVLASVRFNERTDADGKRVLFIEEIQSDWHQQGRKRGYRAEIPPVPTIDELTVEESPHDWLVSGGKYHVRVGKGVVSNQNKAKEYALRYFQTNSREALQEEMAKVPNAPFKTTWPELAFKRMIRWAAENGFERIAWLPGKQQADRYDLSKHVSRVELIDNVTGGVGLPKMEGPFVRGTLEAYDYNERQVIRKAINSEEELAEVIGKEAAAKLMSAEPTQGRTAGMNARMRSLSGLDLQVGGEGMIGFYDQILPAAVNKMVKKWGTRVTRDVVDTTEPTIGKSLTEAHFVDVTPRMREAAFSGLPLFQRNEPLVDNSRATGDQVGGYKAAAQRVIDSWNDKIGWRWGPLGKLPQADAYLRLRYKTLGNLTEVRGIARDIYDTLKKSSAEDSKAAYEYLTTRGAKPDRIQDERIRTTAVSVKDRFDALGQKLVDAGLIPQESADAYTGMYLPRLYLKHILGDQLHAAIGTGKKTSNLGQTKRRDNTIPEEVRKVILGEITDPSFLASFGVARTMRDLAMIDFMEAVSKNEAWTPPAMLVNWRGRQVSPFWMHSEAVRLRKQADFMKDSPLADKARKMADQMDTLANQAISKLERADLDGFKQIPDSPRYGALRGLWVREEIFEDMVGAQNFIDPGSVEAWFQKWGGKVTRAWKTSKVALNPPSHFRNMMGNSIMLQLSGVPHHMQPKRFYQAIMSLKNKDQYYQIARKYGLFEATFSNIELTRITDEWLALQDTNESHFGKLNAMAGSVTNAIGDLYQFEEALFKIMKLRDNMEKGMEEGAAMIDAHKWLFDYSLVPRWVRWARNAPLGTPFLTYTYKAIPRMMEALIRTPHRYLPYIAGYYALQELLQYAFDVDDDDLEKLKKAYPEWTQNKGGLMLLPYRDDNGNLQLFDMGYIVPWGMLADVARQGSNMEGGMMLDSLGVMSGPVADVISGWQTNIDPFTKKPIVDERDPPSEQMKQRLWWAWGLAAPGWLTRSGFSGKLYDYATDAVDKRTGEPKLTGGQVAARFFGLTVYPLNPVESRNTNIFFMQREIEEIRYRMKSRLRDKNLDTGEKAKLRSEYNDLIKEKQQELKLYKNDSEVHPNLRNQSLDDKVGSLMDGKRKPEAVKALRDAGYPAFAALIDEMPARPRPAVAQALASMRA